MQLLFEGGRAASKTLRPMCFMLSVTLQSPVLSSTRLRGTIFLIPFIRYSEMNLSNYYSTRAQMTPKHKNDRHTDLNIHSPFRPRLLLHSSPTPTTTTTTLPLHRENVQQFQIRLSHQLLPVKEKKEEEKQ